MKRALIFGVSGQDGAYLSQFLLGKGYLVHGTSRNATVQTFQNLRSLGIRDRVITHSSSMMDFDELLRLVVAVAPDEIYNLAGMSSVGLSFTEPRMAFESIAGSQMLLLEVLRTIGAPTRLYHAASSECFGDTPSGSAGDEHTRFAPRSPYASAKSAAHWMTVQYREVYGLFACSGILYNHESPMRGESFVTKKIMAAAAATAKGGYDGKLVLGDITVSRGWGYALEYIESMWLMLQQDQPEDFVIATGESHTVEEFASIVFAEFGLDYKDHITIDRSLFRPTEIQANRGNPSRALERLGWKAATTFADLVRLLAAAERSGHRIQSEPYVTRMRRAVSARMST